MGALGTYGRFRTVGPVAAAFAGHLGDVGPAGAGDCPPAGATPTSTGSAPTASPSRMHRRAVSPQRAPGEGQWIDASQSEAGLFIAGTTVPRLVGQRTMWQRYGNRSPYKPAAPHGAYRCSGTDSLAGHRLLRRRRVAGAAAGSPAVRSGSPTAVRHPGRPPRQPGRARRASSPVDRPAAMPYEAMQRLQEAGVPAGVCQTAADRCDRDPQLRHLQWMTEVTGTKIGTWPVPRCP